MKAYFNDFYLAIISARKVWLMIVSISILFSSSITFAAVCDSTIESMGNHKPGGLIVKLWNTPKVKICDFDTNQYEMSASDCKHMASLASMAYAMGKVVRLHTDDTYSCSTLPSWGAVNVIYFGIL